MNRALAAAAMVGVAGCQLIIGDIPIPEDDPRDLAALAGGWRLYGLADGAALDQRLWVDSAGGMGAEEGAVEAGRIRRDPATVTRYLVDLGAGAGEVVGRFDVESGLGVFTEAAGGSVFAVMVREPAAGASLPGGWSVTAGITGAGVLVGGVSLLEAGMSGFVETRFPLDGSGPIERRVAVDGDPEDVSRRGLVPLDGMGGVRWLTPAVGGAVAVGVQQVGAQGAAVLVWEGRAGALPSASVVCYGVGVWGGEVESRVMGARFGEQVRWQDGRSGRAVETGYGVTLAAGQGFFDGVGTLVLASEGGRVFAVLPVEPGDDPKVALRAAWGFGLCVRGEVAGDAGGGAGGAGGAGDMGDAGDTGDAGDAGDTGDAAVHGGG